MLFNSPEFIVFFATVYCAYLILPFRWQNILLLIASYIFYGWWDIRFLFLVALSTTVDYWVGLLIQNGHLTRGQYVRPAAFLCVSALLFLCVNPDALLHTYNVRPLLRWEVLPWTVAGICIFVPGTIVLKSALDRIHERHRRFGFLMISLTTQLGLLATFKYFNFFIDSLHRALASIGAEPHSWHLDIVLPVGISFYTFQSLSYTIDVYRRQFGAVSRFSDFALFVAFFPQLQAGPIERARQLIPQLSKPRNPTFEQVLRGIYLILFGYFKKVAIADGVAPIVDQIFGSSGRVTWIDVVAGSAMFAIQIYCDFSGYTDIARGLSKLLGIEMMLNFRLPYFATNPQDFWHRWHISLSTWLRDYLYIPLGGSRGGAIFTCRNIMATMLLGGLWHGAAWNYVLWGFYQGLLLCIYHLLKQAKCIGHRTTPPNVTIKILSMAGFFALTCYGWLLFRAHSLAQVTQFSRLLLFDFGNLDYGGGIPRLSALIGVVLLIPMEIAQYRSGTPQYYRSLPVPALGLLTASLMVATLIGMSNEPAQFIYFQF
jgi:alginate O-acetyltransferase complex protein AlgI